MGRKAYGSIPHLPGSRVGIGDHTVNPGQARIATSKQRDHLDCVIVTEKMDGACCAIARINGEVVPVTRSGHRAADSPYAVNRAFADWTLTRAAMFRDLLNDGERVVGEWMGFAHGTKYRELTDLFYGFDLMRDSTHATFQELHVRFLEHIGIVPVVSWGPEPLSIADAMGFIGQTGRYGALPEDRAEGAVWRVQRRGRFDFMAKYVRPGKIDGKYMPDFSDQTEYTEHSTVGAPT